jgi:hypothetical protein
MNKIVIAIVIIIILLILVWVFSIPNHTHTLREKQRRILKNLPSPDLIIAKKEEIQKRFNELTPKIDELVKSYEENIKKLSEIPENQRDTDDAKALKTENEEMVNGYDDLLSQLNLIEYDNFILSKIINEYKNGIMEIRRLRIKCK